MHYQINQRLSPNFNNYFTLAKFSHSRQTRTTASSNSIVPLYKTKRTQTFFSLFDCKGCKIKNAKFNFQICHVTSEKERNNRLNIPVRKFGIPFLMILKTSHSESF